MESRSYYFSFVYLSGHKNYVLCVAWSPDGKKLASGSYTKKDNGEVSIIICTIIHYYKQFLSD